MSVGKIAKVLKNSVAPSMSIVQALEVMRTEGLEAIPVTVGTMPVGMFTVADASFKVILEGLNPRETRVGDIMTPNFVKANRGTSVERAIRMMNQNKVHHLPVVTEEGDLQGIVSMKYLLGEVIDQLRATRF